MNRINARRMFLAGLTAVSVALGVEIHAQQQPGRLKVLDATALHEGQGTADAKSIQINVKDGDVRVKVDGKEIDASRIQREGNRIVIHGEDGGVLQEFMLGPWGEGFQYSFGDTYGTWMPQMFNADEGGNPKVMLGIHMGEPGPALEKHLKLQDSATTMVHGVYEGLAAHEAGLEEFDIITEVDGKTPADAESIRKAIADKNAGDKVTFTVIHAGDRVKITVTLREFDPQVMGKAKLLGRAADPLTRLRSGNWMGLLPNRDGQQMFVVPDLKDLPNAEQFKDFQSLRPFLDRQRERGREQAEPRRDGIESQLDRLDKRMADLESMIERLLKERSRN